jgi:hypothetical protein
MRDARRTADRDVPDVTGVQRLAEDGEVFELRFT